MKAAFLGKPAGCSITPRWNRLGRLWNLLIGKKEQAIKVAVHPG